MDEFEVVAQIPEPPTFLCDEVVRCEVVVTRANTQTKWDIRSVEGILVGQYRLNTVAIAQNLQSHHEFAQIVPRKLPGGDYRLDSVFDAGLDPQSRVSWIGHLKSGTQFPFFAIDEKSCTKITLRARLPEHLPPSYRGNIIRFAYKALIQVQVGNISPRLLHLPFRVLPSVRAYYHSSPSLSAVSSTISVTLPVLMGSDYHGSLITSDRDSNPFRNDSTGQFGCGTSPLGDGCLSREELHPAVFDRLSQLLTEAQMSYSNRSHGTKKARGRKKRIRKESPSRLPSAMFAEMVSSSSVATFVISGPNGHICRIGFFKTAARLGDSLRGFLDFQAAAVPCFECVIRATTNEYFDLSFQQENTLEKDLLFFTTPIEVPRDSREKAPTLLENTWQTVWFETRLMCSNTRFLPFSIPILLNAPPEFMITSNFFTCPFRVQWCLRFEFAVAKTLPGRRSRSSLEPKLFNLFLQEPSTTKFPDYTPSINCDRQIFPWELPISIVPNGPGAFIFPNESRSICTVSLG